MAQLKYIIQCTDCELKYESSKSAYVTVTMIEHLRENNDHQMVVSAVVV